MKKLLNTLYVSTEGAYLGRQRETILVRVEHETRLQLPATTLEGVVTFGNVSCSPFMMQLCAEKGVGLTFLSRNGRFIARAEGPLSGNVLLRRTQYRKADDLSAAASIARSFVAGKVSNARAVLRRTIRDARGEASEELARASNRLAMLLRQLSSHHDLDALRGIEGEAASRYFGVFQDLIREPEAFSFARRSKRPPMDRVNAMLSFVYSLLGHDAASALAAVGLDPAVGFLHRDRPGRESLALDLMEEFRPVLGDRLVLSLINRKQVSPGGFNQTESGAVWMDDKTRKALITAYQKRKRDELTHPFLGETAPVGLLMHLQAKLLARHLRGDLDAYPPFFWK